MKLAFSISGHRPGGDAIACARIAEEHGFDTVWLTEDYFERGAFAVAGAIAARTSRVHIGLGVLNPWTRHPVLTAMEFAALDEIADGRAVLGLGSSNSRWMQEQLGIPFDRPLSRLVEASTLMREVLRGQHVAHVGDRWRVNAGLAFQPLRPEVPLIWGVKGRRALSFAGIHADGVLLSVLSAPEYVRWATQQIGRPLALSAYVVFACDADRPARARDRVRADVATFLGVHGDHDITRVAGVDPDLAMQFRSGWVQGQPRIDLVTDDLVDRFAVAGSPEDCAAGMARFADAGLDTLVVRDDLTQPADALLEAARQAADA